MRGADGEKIAVLRKGLAKLTFLRAAAHAHVIPGTNMEEFTKNLGISDHDFRLIIGRTKIDYDETKEYINRKNMDILY